MASREPAPAGQVALQLLAQFPHRQLLGAAEALASAQAHATLEVAHQLDRVATSLERIDQTLRDAEANR